MFELRCILVYLIDYLLKCTLWSFLETLDISNIHDLCSHGSSDTKMIPLESRFLLVSWIRLCIQVAGNWFNRLDCFCFFKNFFTSCFLKTITHRLLQYKLDFLGNASYKMSSKVFWHKTRLKKFFGSHRLIKIAQTYKRG